MPSRQQDFVNQAYWDARSAGLPDPQARLAAAQAALETGYGKSVKGNNYYGIKAGPSWQGPVVNAKTWEEENGRRVNQSASFRAYSNPVDSFRDWAATVGNRWSAAMSAPTFKDAVSALGAGKRGGYATDSRYGSKLDYINERFNPDPMGIMAAIDPQSIPTPTPRPDPAPAYGIMAAIDPPTPRAVERAPLGPISPSPVTYGGLLGGPRVDAPQPAAFDMGRFGPVQSAVKETPVAAFAPKEAPPAFDPGRFGPQIQTPTAPSAVMDRFATTQPVAQGMAGLQRGLMDQQLAAGILPSIPAVVTDPVKTAAVPGYVDPQVRAPNIQEVPQQPAPPSISAQPSFQAQPAQPAMSAAQRTYNERMALGAPAPSALGPQMARDAQRGLGQRSMIGGIGGALLGGALLGPVGGLLGGLMGRSYAQRTYSPPAPERIPGQPMGTAAGGGVSYGDLNDYGREAYSSSGDFRDAIDSGGVGLY